MLQCVVCGGSISKQGDVFVCQTCGCQYSLEEVRRMASEGGAPAAGAPAAPAAAEAPQTEGSGYSKLDNLYILARRARENNNSEDAAKYYHEILLEDPNSWEAAFYGVYYTAMKCKIGEIASAADSVSNCLESTMDLILKNVPKEEQKAAYTEVANSACSIAGLLYNAAKNTYMNSTYSNAGTDMINRGVSSLLVYTKAGNLVSQKFGDDALAKSIYERGKSIGVIRRNGRTIDLGSIAGFDDRLGDLRRKELERERDAKRQKIEAYWEEHAGEKAALEEEKKALNEKITELDARINEAAEKKKSIPEKKAMSELSDRISELALRRNSLGMFKNKEKKALQDEIDKLEGERKSLSDRILQIENEIDAKESQPFRKEKRAAQDRVIMIEKELSKER